MQTTLNFAMNAPQRAIHNSRARFKVAVAGRRCGKTTGAVMSCIIEALKEVNERGVKLRSDSEVVYFGVDKEQARRNAWYLFKEFAGPIAKDIREKDSMIVLQNDVRIRLMGMDNPDSARGMKLRYAVLDEYADMPEEAWGAIIRPALMDVRGGALFIGTPKGRNHFYDLYRQALSGDLGPEWEAFQFSSYDNSTIPKEEMEALAREYTNGSQDLYEQEILGKFVTKGGQLFREEWFPVSSMEPELGSYVIAVDLAGFAPESTKRNAELRKLDDTAIAIVKKYPIPDKKTGTFDEGWWIKDIRHGKWGVEETARQIVSAYLEHEATVCGIEKGALKNAVDPYIAALQSKTHRWLTIEPLTHGNKSKYDRVQWALQGRAQRGLITLNSGPWNAEFIDQIVSFPAKLVHDDLVDAVAYVDQLDQWIPTDTFRTPEPWIPMDDIAGY